MKYIHFELTPFTILPKEAGIFSWTVCSVTLLSCFFHVLVKPAVFSLCFILLCVSATHADAPENIPVCVAPDGQFLPRAINDGKGGTVVVWEDYRTGKDWDVYTQRIDASGNIVWDASGVAICRAGDNQRRFRIVRNANKIIVVWNDRRARTNWDVYAQAIDLSGKILWAEGGVPVCTTPAGQTTREILSDGAGGVIVMWSQWRDLYMQRIDANGNSAWGIDGIPVFHSDSIQGNPKLVFDEAKGFLSRFYRKGFYVVWWEVVDYHKQWHIMVYRLDMNGKPLWKGPIRVSPQEGMKGEPRVVSDGKGGIIVVWQIYDNFINDNLYAQRIDRRGNRLWGENGVPICTATGIQKNASIASDGHGGVVAVWRDERDIYSDLYAQRISADGKPQWKSDGVPICTAGGLQDAPFLITSGTDEFFVAWLDYREDYGDQTNDAIYAQKINSEGKTLWTENGIPICTANGDQQPPFVVQSESGELTIVWSDARRDLGDIYIHRLR